MRRKKNFQHGKEVQQNSRPYSSFAVPGLKISIPINSGEILPNFLLWHFFLSQKLTELEIFNKNPLKFQSKSIGAQIKLYVHIQNLQM